MAVQALEDVTARVWLRPAARVKVGRGRDDEPGVAQHPWPTAPAVGRGVDAVVPENLQRLRARRRWRQQDLAAAAGWARATVVAIETGERRVTLRDAVALCRVLGVPLSALVEGSDDAAVLGVDVGGVDEPGEPQRLAP